MLLIYHPTTTAQGLAVTHFRVARVEIRADMVNAHVWLDAWVDEASRLDGNGPAAPFFVAVPLAALDLGAGLEAALGLAVLDDPLFVGGTLIADAADTLGAAQSRKWAEVKAVRTARLAGSFEWDGHLFNVDAINLTGAAVDAMAAEQADETYAQAWVLADNSVIELDSAQQLAVGRACKAYISALWATSQALRAQIYAAVDVDEVAAVAWPA